eukprot:5539671-Prymnesium_polylepis.1
MHLPHTSTLGSERPSMPDPPECEICTRPSWTVNSQVVVGLNSGGDVSGLAMHQYLLHPDASLASWCPSPTLQP